MCYSALVNQHAKNLGLTYKARIQIDMFDDIFKGRLDGNGAKISAAMEAPFLEKPKSPVELRIAKNIRAFHAAEIKKSTKELEAQELRLATAEKSLAGKVTKKAQNDQRIATNKIEKLRYKIERLKSGKLSESDSRIYPGQYAPLVFEQDGERWVAPFRYLLRPKGHPEDFDRRYSGCYNARRDNLAGNFWKPIFGRNHGILEIKSFWENVAKEEYEKRQRRKLKALKGDADSENIILRFDPTGLDKMIVPCIFDFNTEGDFPLQSFALITDEPNPEIAAAGHDRTPIIMKPEHLDRWLKTPTQDLKSFNIVFDDKQPTFFEHEVAA